MAALEDRNKTLATNVVHAVTHFRNSEKMVEQQQEIIDNLEKTRDQMTKNAVENAETVITSCVFSMNEMKLHRF